MNLITKIGLVPYHDDMHGERMFLLHKPAPKRNPNDDVPYGLCRGTRRYREGEQLIDARNASALTSAQIQALEPLEDTATQEAWEELGLPREAMGELQSLGEIRYDSPNKSPYPIHWFACEVKDKNSLTPPEDAAATCWASSAEIEKLAAEGHFKSGYLAVLQALGTK